jgi:hypothetical protein
VSRLLATKQPTSGSRRYYHGFDISSAQFPKTLFESNLELSVHDILQPFHKEHLGRYDLVNVRLLVGAIKETDYMTAVTNAASLLSQFPRFSPVSGETLMIMG